MAVRAPASRPRPVLPKLVGDPTWSLRPCGLIVTVCGRDVEIPAMVAADWLVILMQERWTFESVLPGLLEPEEADWVEECLYTERLSIDDFERLHLDILTTVTGRPWYVALRLIEVARTSWNALGGEVVVKADATSLSIAGWLDVLYLLILRNMDESKVSMFLAQLEMPPIGFAEDPAELEMSPAAFMALGSD